MINHMINSFPFSSPLRYFEENSIRSSTDILLQSEVCIINDHGSLNRNLFDYGRFSTHFFCDHINIL